MPMPMSMLEAAGVHEWVETFNVWVWEPPYFRPRVRGLCNAALYIRPGAFTVEARRFYSYISGWRAVEYRWPAVVVETLRPLGDPGLLFEMSGKLARCQVRRDGARLRQALDSAGFAVIEVRHWGWEKPHPVAASELGGHAGSVPRSVVAPVG